MDDGRAASDAVMASSGAHQPRVTRYSESRTTNAPARCPFLLLTFLLGKQKKSKVQKLKRNFHAQSKERHAAASVDFVPFCLTNERVPAVIYL